jgi:uncharacterized protein (TIGR02145 family)
MRHASLPVALLMAAATLQAQPCVSTSPPSGLSSTYTEGSGALLQWTAIPSSVGVQIRATTPSGANVKRRILGPELGQYLVPDPLLEPGTYTWRVQVACGTGTSTELTPVSAEASFTVGGSGACPATVTDVDGNVYNTVEIGGQCWMAENLATETYRDGSAIPTGLSNGAWATTTGGASAAWNNDPANKVTYGLLYNGYAVTDARGICPVGWHVPTDAEWTELTDHLGGEAVAGGPMKSTGTSVAGTGLWTTPNTGATNASGFSGLPGGVRAGAVGNFGSLGLFGFWWSASESSTGKAWVRLLRYDISSVVRVDYEIKSGRSVRCLRDE